MTPVDWMLDGLLACALPLLAWRTLASGNSSEAVVLFIAFGSLSALTWARLGAADIALVEAAVGAGLTGALLMTTFQWARPSPPRPRSAPGWRALRWLLAAVLAAALASALWMLPGPSRGLSDEALAALPRSGVEHPVTAILLNYRAYDTLLEMTVLLVATLGVQSQRRRSGAPRPAPIPGPMLPALVRLVVPGVVLVAGYLLWRGSHAAGGAFQAGTILGGGAILLILSDTVQPPAFSRLWVRAVLLIGPVCFLAVGVAPLFAGKQLLEYPQGWAKALIVGVESALTLSIGLMLTSFVPSSAHDRETGTSA